MLAAIIIVLLFNRSFLKDQHSKNEHFNSSIWLKDGKRSSMAKCICLNSGTYEGMSKSKIKKLFGAPDYDEDNSYHNNFGVEYLAFQFNGSRLVDMRLEDSSYETDFGPSF